MQEIDFTVNGIYHAIEFIESQDHRVYSINCSLKNACVFQKMSYINAQGHFDYNTSSGNDVFDSDLIGYIFNIPVRRNALTSNHTLKFRTESGEYDFPISEAYKYPRIMILKND